MDSDSKSSAEVGRKVAKTDLSDILPIFMWVAGAVVAVAAIVNIRKELEVIRAEQAILNAAPVLDPDSSVTIKASEAFCTAPAQKGVRQPVTVNGQKYQLTCP